MNLLLLFGVMLTFCGTADGGLTNLCSGAWYLYLDKNRPGHPDPVCFNFVTAAYSYQQASDYCQRKKLGAEYKHGSLATLNYETSKHDEQGFLKTFGLTMDTCRHSSGLWLDDLDSQTPCSKWFCRKDFGNAYHYGSDCSDGLSLVCQFLPKTCNIPSTPANAIKPSIPSDADHCATNGKHCYHGTTLTYECEHGYSYGQQISQSIKCENEQWSQSLRNCKKHCTLPTSLSKNILPVDRQYYYNGESVELRCKSIAYSAGEKMVQSPECSADGKWVPSPKECLKGCNVAKLPKNFESGVYDKSKLTGTDIYPSGVTITVTCKTGYTAEGSREEQQRATCTENKWDKMTDCKKQCTTATILPANIKPVDREYYSGEPVELHCESTYSIGDKNVQSAMCNDGNWDQPVECVKGCKELPLPKNYDNFVYEKSKVPGTDVYPSGVMITVTCISGYTFEGSAKKQQEATCTEDKWEQMADCKKQCTTATILPPNIKPVDREYYSGEPVELHCESTYSIGDKNVQSAMCNDGNWDKPVECVKGCKELPLPKNYNSSVYDKSKVSGTDIYPSGVIITVTCISGYTFVGSAKKQQKATCIKDEWEQMADCEQVCTTASWPANIKPVDQQYYSGQSVELHCISSYSVGDQSTQSLTCTDGSWNPQPKECVSMCNDPSLPKGVETTNRESTMKKVEGMFPNGTALTVYCADKHSIGRQASQSAQCTTGEWDLPLTECKQMCDDPPLSENLSYDQLEQNETKFGDMYPSGSVLSTKCKNDDYSSGTDTVQSIKCTEGTWNPVVKCLQVCKRPPKWPDGIEAVVSKSKPLTVDHFYQAGTILTVRCNMQRFVPNSTAVYVNSTSDLNNTQETTCQNGQWDPVKPCQHICTWNNGGCEHKCHFDQSTRELVVCLCEPGYKLDGKHCKKMRCVNPFIPAAVTFILVAFLVSAVAVPLIVFANRRVNQIMEDNAEDESTTQRDEQKKDADLSVQSEMTEDSKKLKSETENTTDQKSDQTSKTEQPKQKQDNKPKPKKQRKSNQFTTKRSKQKKNKNEKSEKSSSSSSSSTSSTSQKSSKSSRTTSTKVMSIQNSETA